MVEPWAARSERLGPAVAAVTEEALGQLALVGAARVAGAQWGLAAATVTVAHAVKAAPVGAATLAEALARQLRWCCQRPRPIRCSPRICRRILAA